MHIHRSIILIIYRRILSADIPDSQELSGPVLRLIEECFTERLSNGEDTLYTVVRPTYTFKDAVEKIGEYESINNNKDWVTEDLDQDSINYYFDRADGIIKNPDTKTIYFLHSDVLSLTYAWESPRYLTMALNYTATYYAGGGGTADTTYFTIDKKTGKILTLSDFVSAEKEEEFYNFLAQTLYTSEENTYSEDDTYSDGGRLRTLEEISETLESMYQTEDPEIKVAIYGDKLIIGYDGAIISEYGETGFLNIFVPLSEMKQFQ